MPAVMLNWTFPINIRPEEIIVQDSNFDPLQPIDQNSRGVDLLNGKSSINDIYDWFACSNKLDVKIDCIFKENILKEITFLKLSKGLT